MSGARTVSENGSFRLVEQDGRFAVVEVRDGRVYGLETARDGSVGAGRPGVPDRPEALATVLGPGDWTDEPTARHRFDSLARQGDRLARTIW